MKPNTRNTQIDCLRGIASLLVIGAHFHSVPPPGPVGFIAASWKIVGPVGVDLFFVLSGFLIGTLLITERQKHGNLNVPRFLVRRGFKLYPVYYLFMAYCIVIPAIKATLASTQDGWSKLAEGLKIHWTCLVFLQNYGLQPDAEGHTWSLAVEEHFYLVLPLAIALLGPKRTWKWLIPLSLSFVPICLGLRVLAAYQHPAGAFPFGETHLRVDALLFGVALAMTALKFPEIFARLGSQPRLLIVGGVALWVVAFLPFWPEMLSDTFGFTVRLLGSAAILVGACNLRDAQPGKISAMLAWVGANSYAIYVWHVTGIGMMEKTVGKLLRNHIQNQNVQWILLSLVIILFCITVGAFVTKLIETPVLNLRNRWFPSRGRAIVLPGAASVTKEIPAVNAQIQSVQTMAGK
jgi:peptidoglycan/LPS O-acetylase OafA/YrhL